MRDFRKLWPVDRRSIFWLRFALSTSVGLFALCSVCAAAPPQSSGPPNPMTVQEAIRYALDHYPAVQAAIQKHVAAHAGIGLAKTSYLPSLSMLYQDNRATRNNVAGMLLPQSVIPNPSGTVLPGSSQSFWGSGAGILLTEDPFDFGYRRAELRLAELTARRTQEEVVLTRLDVAATIADASLLLLAADQQVQASQADVDRRAVFAKSVHALVDAHLRPGTDASRVDAELAEARTRMVLAEEAQQVNSVIFAQVLGLAGSRVQVAEGPFLRAPAEESWTTPPPARHPAAEIGRERVDESQARIDALTRSYFPKFSIQAVTAARGSGANAQGQTLGGTQGLWPNSADNWAAGFSITFQALDFASIRAHKKIEEANRGQQVALYNETVQNVTAQVGEAQAVVDASRKIAENTPIELQASRDSETQAVARFKAGLGTIVDVAEAQQLLLQAQTDDSLATLNVWRALAHLAAAQGDLQPFIDLANQAATGRP
ncbi:MAG: TolC family protein [Candidatus Acidiferrales bacterium]